MASTLTTGPAIPPTTGRRLHGPGSVSPVSPGEPASARPAARDSDRASRAAPTAGAALAQRRAQLEDLWRDELDRLTELSVAYYDAVQQDATRGARYVPAPGAGDTGETGSRRLRQLARCAMAGRRELAEIEAALDRLVTGTYGLCEQCGRPISAARLAARPQSRSCTACTHPIHRTDKGVSDTVAGRPVPGMNGALGALAVPGPQRH